MIQVLDTLLPVFAIIGLAFWLGRRGWLTHAFVSELNWLIFWVSLPALIIHSLATAPSLPRDTGPIVILFFIATLIVIALSFPVCRFLRLPREQIGTFVQAAFRGNLAYTGLPIVIFALHDQTREVVALAVAQVMFVLAPAMILYNVIAVFLLVGSQEGFSLKKVREIVGKVVTNPLILASVIGVGIFALPAKPPHFVFNTLDLIGQMAAPAALFCVGGAMAFVSMEGRYRSASVASVLKILILPAIAAGLLLFVDVEPVARLVLLVLSACPTAVASYIMAKELGGDEALAAGSIIISTVACIPVLGLIIAFA